jgi:LysR family hydrogen peroxide-inducible transcriptional activator
LEQEVGGRLFERHARGVVLTALGERALEHARTVLREAETLRGLRRATVREKPMRLGVLPTLAPAFVADTLARLSRLLDQRGWRAEDAHIETLRRRLASGRYDAILTSLGRLESGYGQTELARDAQALALPRGHGISMPIAPEALAGRPLIVRTHCEQLQSASRILDERGVKPLIVARTDSDDRALALVAAGLGACLMPDSFTHEGVVFVRPQGVNLARRLGLQWIRGGWIDAVGGGL